MLETGLGDAIELYILIVFSKSGNLSDPFKAMSPARAELGVLPPGLQFLYQSRICLMGMTILMSIPFDLH